MVRQNPGCVYAKELALRQQREVLLAPDAPVSRSGRTRWCTCIFESRLVLGGKNDRKIDREPWPMGHGPTEAFWSPS
jgi:hypothetical protein